MTGDIIAAALGCWLAAIATRKLLNLPSFRDAILTWQLFDPRRILGAARLMCTYELALGAVLVATAAISSGEEYARATALATGLAYVAGQLAILRWTRNATCGCTGRHTGIGAVSLLHASLVALTAAISLTF